MQVRHLRVLAVLFVLAVGQLNAQNLTVLHSFTGGQDGQYPFAGLARDSAGNLYGAAYYGGLGFGTVFRLQARNGRWTFHPLYSFLGNGEDGANPLTVVLGPNGTVYGTTIHGGSHTCACGTVFNVAPPSNIPRSVLSPWNETLLHQFVDTDGSSPSGNLVFDSSGNLYGTTQDGGMGDGTVFQLSHPNGIWVLSDIYQFVGTSNGFNPYGGVVIDASGNLYGTTAYGGAFDDGTVFELTNPDGMWTERVLYSFQNGADGGHPYTALTLDSAGNLYGATGSGGPNNTGTVFQLTPSGGGNWTFNLIYSFGASSGSMSPVTLDAAGDLYGTIYEGPHFNGSIFELMRGSNGWTYIDLHDFSGSDGEQPVGPVQIDTNGNLYGTTATGGADSYGVVWELTPQPSENLCAL